MKKDKLISYAKLQENYPNEYVARKDNKVLAHAKTYTQLIKKLTEEKLDRSKLIIGFVPPVDKICIYAS